MKKGWRVTVVSLLVGTLLGSGVASFRGDHKYSRVAKKCIPATVTIHVMFEVTEETNLLFDSPGALGSGVIIDSRGIVLTCAHLFSRPVSTITVLVQDAEGNVIEYPAEFLAKNEMQDLGLIRINAKKVYPFVKLARSIQVGEEVIAIGAPLGLDWTVTRGIISHLYREVGQNPWVLQADVAINPGNSGGPLFNLRGELIGINVMLANAANLPIFTGLAFTVPPDVCRIFLKTNQRFFK